MNIPVTTLESIKPVVRDLKHRLASIKEWEVTKPSDYKKSIDTLCIELYWQTLPIVETCLPKGVDNFYTGILWTYSGRLRDFISSETRVWKDDMFNVSDTLDHDYLDLELKVSKDSNTDFSFLILAETIARQVPNAPFNPIFTNLLTVLENGMYPIWVDWWRFYVYNPNVIK